MIGSLEQSMNQELLSAAQNGDLEVINRLIENATSVNAADKNGQ